MAILARVAHNVLTSDCKRMGNVVAGSRVRSRPPTHFFCPGRPIGALQLTHDHAEHGDCHSFERTHHHPWKPHYKTRGPFQLLHRHAPYVARSQRTCSANEEGAVSDKILPSFDGLWRALVPSHPHPIDLLHHLFDAREHAA